MDIFDPGNRVILPSNFHEIPPFIRSSSLTSPPRISVIHRRSRRSAHLPTPSCVLDSRVYSSLVLGCFQDCSGFTFFGFVLDLVKLICAMLKALARGLPLRRVRPGCILGPTVCLSLVISWNYFKKIARKPIRTAY